VLSIVISVYSAGSISIDELLIEILRANPGGQRGSGRMISRWIVEVEEDTKHGVVEIGGYRMEVAGDICLKRPRPTQGRRADEDDDDDDDDDGYINLWRRNYFFNFSTSCI